MRPHRSHVGVDAVLKSALAGSLALLLFLAATLSVNHALHRSLHQGAPSNDHLCLVCSLLNGQLSAAEAAIVPVVVVLCILFGGVRAVPGPFSAVDFRFSPCRAPPRR